MSQWSLRVDEAHPEALPKKALVLTEKSLIFPCALSTFLLCLDLWVVLFNSPAALRPRTRPFRSHSGRFHDWRAGV